MWWLLAEAALAADWPMLQGTEPGPDQVAVRPFGFVQVLGEGIVFGEPVHGLSPALAAFDGERPQFDRVGTGAATWGLSVRRARLDLRGAIPGTDGAYVAGASGFRDVGVEVFDTFALGRGELSYAAMLSDGRMGTFDDDSAKDVTGRLCWTPVVWGDRAAIHRDELGFFAYWQEGPRTVDAQTVERIRRGGGFKLERSGWRARAEIVEAEGAIEAGPNPPFPGQPVQETADGRAIGGHAFVHWQPGLVGGGLCYDDLRRDTEDPAALRVFRTWTADLQFRLDPRARILIDYERRSLAAPDGSSDAGAIARTMGDRVSVQVGAMF